MGRTDTAILIGTQ